MAEKKYQFHGSYNSPFLKYNLINYKYNVGVEKNQLWSERSSKVLESQNYKKKLDFNMIKVNFTEPTL